jgi:pantetheine-phosphate adenylyltransferase
MERIALFPGTFDPPTLGHHDIIERASGLFDVLWLGVGMNSTKSAMIPFDGRIKVLKDIYNSHPNIKIAGYEELTVSFCKKIGAQFIIRGLRSATDFDYERNIAAMNNKLEPGIETVFLISRPEYAPINSTIVREIWKNKGNISSFVDAKVIELLVDENC